MLEEVIMKNAEIAKICSELVSAHPQGWRVLRRHLPSERDDLESFAQHVCAKFREELGGDWWFSLQKNRYARVWRSDWEAAFGTGADPPIAGVMGAKWQFARTHLRLSVEPPDPDSTAQYFKYEVRLKLSRRGPTDVENRLRAVDHASERIVGLPKRRDPGSSTLTISQLIRKLQAIDLEPLFVIDWVMTTHVADIAKAIQTAAGGSEMS